MDIAMFLDRLWPWVQAYLWFGVAITAVVIAFFGFVLWLALKR